MVGLFAEGACGDHDNILFLIRQFGSVAARPERDTPVECQRHYLIVIVTVQLHRLRVRER